MESRYHPVIEGMRVNEDGTEIFIDNNPLRIKTESAGSRYVHIGDKRVTVIRLICECWHGMPEFGKAARRVDERSGDHYSNLYWGSRGMTLNSAKYRAYEPRPIIITLDQFKALQKRKEKRELGKALTELGLSRNAYLNAEKRYKND